MMLISKKDMRRVMLKYSHVLRAELVSIAEQWTPSKGWVYRDLSTCFLVSRHLVISSWHGCYFACLTICVGACVGCHSPSSGVPVWAAKVRVSPVAFQCWLFQLSFSSGVPVYTASIRWVAQWYPSVHSINQWHSSGIPVYTGPASVHWLRVGVPTVLQSPSCARTYIPRLLHSPDRLTVSNPARILI